MKKAYLVLEDGTVFEGESFGAEGEVIGEVVFDTGMVGYQEALTDPSFAGLTVMMTYPLIGNCGVNDEDNESEKPVLKGLIIKEPSLAPNNFRCQGNLGDYLKKHNIITLTGIDTRALTGKIRSEGVMNGVITFDASFDYENRKDEIKAYKVGAVIDSVSCKEKYTVGSGKYKVSMLDLGAKRSIIENIAAHDCTVTVYPASTSADEILADKPDGIVLSNGPSDPLECPVQIETAKQLLDSKIPLMGICLGHLILAAAAGAKTKKMKFGHRGANQPVKDLSSGRTYITSQNYGYTVDADSIDEKVLKVSHINVNDLAIEGLEYVDRPAFSIAFHPGAVPGAHSTKYMLERFIDMMGGNK